MPGGCQSPTASRQPTGRIPSAAATLGERPHCPYGARKYAMGRSGTAEAIASVASRRSASMRSSGQSVRSSWCMPWLPSRWPSAAMACTMSGYLSANWPSRKKIARTSCRRSTSNSRGVSTGLGPSSKVRQTARSPGTVSITSMPRRSPSVSSRSSLPRSPRPRSRLPRFLVPRSLVPPCLAVRSARLPRSLLRRFPVAAALVAALDDVALVGVVAPGGSRWLVSRSSVWRPLASRFRCRVSLRRSPRCVVSVDIDRSRWTAEKLPAGPRCPADSVSSRQRLRGPCVR